MLAPVSLRSKQPSRPNLKTYGSRNKRNVSSSSASEGAASSTTQTKRLFDWDRLAMERKARLERTLEQAKKRAKVQAESPEPEFSDEMLEALIYSDREDDLEIEMPRRQNDQRDQQYFVASSQGSQDATGESHRQWNGHQQGFKSPLKSRHSTLFTDQRPAIPSHGSKGNTEFGSSKPQHSTTQKDGPAKGNVSSAAHSKRSSFSSSSSSRSSSSKPGSIHLRSVMFKEKLFSEHDPEEEDTDADNTTGEDEVLFRTPSQGMLERMKQIRLPQFSEPQANQFAFNNIKSSFDSPLITAKAMRNPFLLDSDSRSPSPLLPHSRSTQNLRPNQYQPQKDPEHISHAAIKSQQGKRLQSTSTDRQTIANATTSTHTLAKVETGARYERAASPVLGQNGREDSPDVDLGRRISSIEITPRRRRANQMRFDTLDRPTSPTSLGAPNSESVSTKSHNRGSIEPIKAGITFNVTQKFFVTDVPGSAGSTYTFDASPRFPFAEQIRTPPPAVALPTSIFEEKRPLSTLTDGITRQYTAETLQQPTSISSTAQQRQQQPQQRRQATPSERSNRPIRSLRRPPAALVGNRQFIFRPTIRELLSICDQRFFEQFQGPKHSSLSERQQQQQKGGIMDFDTLLPKSLLESLTKIGEASYSEVYTVDLPVPQSIRRDFEDRGRSSKAGRSSQSLNLDWSTRLKEYVKESLEDDLAPKERKKSESTPKLVMKIIPFENEVSGSGTTTGKGRRIRNKAAWDSTLLALEDIYREVLVSTQIMHGWKGFIGSFGQIKEQRVVDRDQLYCIILLPYGGVDLEHCALDSWQQAWSILAQIAASLEAKEQAPYWFEHRDLHWGNILVKQTRQESIEFTVKRSVPSFGIAVQMIDFTLARVQGDKGNLIYMDLEKDQDLFRGQGDYQFEVYRKMRKQVGKDWAASCSRTNLLWIHYVADKLLAEKEIELPEESSLDEIESSRSVLSSRARQRLGITATRTPASVLWEILESGNQSIVEAWCYDRVLAVSKISLDRWDPLGKTPSESVLDILFDSK
ncbi:Serine/threonine-protein kinase haspin [Lunasporangiospora selenospora]|uniref:non-specific serine/threonine protein kinase n=1 Tax=Lunasporangiospora selenospora TaxID=979761 RepID=A0A9P6KHV6_9FUNG|nr:Serine/threonine-protein kinase haspin [Lunasporangiospora selenospora]